MRETTDAKGKSLGSQIAALEESAAQAEIILRGVRSDLAREQAATCEQQRRGEVSCSLDVRVCLAVVPEADRRGLQVLGAELAKVHAELEEGRQITDAYAKEKIELAETIADLEDSNAKLWEQISKLQVRALSTPEHATHAELRP